MKTPQVRSTFVDPVDMDERCAACGTRRADDGIDELSCVGFALDELAEIDPDELDLVTAAEEEQRIPRSPQSRGDQKTVTL